MKEFWDNRYKQQAYAYGTEPNRFFKEQLEQLQPGKILLPADGEGRNGVFAAKLGWQVTSVDLSAEGKLKAFALAAANEATLDYIVGDLERLPFEPASFDVIGLIYAHFAADKKAALHRKLNRYLRPGGTLILEAFGKNHLKFNHSNPKVGGPKEPGMLYSTAEIKTGFPGHEIVLLEEKEIVLNEGTYHVGTGSVVRYVGKKQS
jgi:SAM-dependent methyltransferase